MDKAHFFPLMLTFSYYFFSFTISGVFSLFVFNFSEMDWLWTIPEWGLGEKRPTCWFHVNMVALVQCFGSKASASRFPHPFVYISPTFAFRGR